MGVQYVATRSPHVTSGVAVAWAGEDRSQNWMDTGRAYAERWHHQMQIRDAVETDGLFHRRWFYPVLDLSVRAFRRSYKDVPAAIGTAVVFEVEGRQRVVGYPRVARLERCSWTGSPRGGRPARGRRHGLEAALQRAISGSSACSCRDQWR
jgi:hypothetical protein